MKEAYTAYHVEGIECDAGGFRFKNGRYCVISSFMMRRTRATPIHPVVKRLPQARRDNKFPW